MPLEGGDEVRIVDQGRPGTLAVINDGIANFSVQSQPNPTIDFYSFATGKWTMLLSQERSKALGFAGRLSVSPDGQWVIYTQTDQIVNDIMLVENFH